MNGKRALGLLLALGILGLATPSFAAGDDVQALLNSNGCMACHAVDQTLVGPSFKMVADRYRGKGAVDMLAKKILDGGGGNWSSVTGSMAMPPHPDLPMDKAKEIVNWILSLK
jgi:cytochrome c